MTARRQAIGRSGERRAAAWYRRAGYDIVAQNWRATEGELDLVAWRDGILVICEVKNRSSNRFGDGFAAVTHAKQARLRTLALVFLRQWDGPRPTELRFDVASVSPSAVEVIEAAF